jgi:hypothetical protein
MAHEYMLVELQGPLDGDVVQAPVVDRGWPANVIGLPVFVLDEATETFGWDTGNYFPGKGERWRYAYSRTLPGYPALSRDHGA